MQDLPVCSKIEQGYLKSLLIFTAVHHVCRCDLWMEGKCDLYDRGSVIYVIIIGSIGCRLHCNMPVVCSNSCSSIWAESCLGLQRFNLLLGALFGRYENLQWCSILSLKGSSYRHQKHTMYSVLSL